MSEVPASIQTEGLPEAGDVMDELLRGGRDRFFTTSHADHDYVLSRLDEIAPIQAYYVPTVTPATGRAPEHIKAQWVGLQLPIRAKHTDKDIEGFAVMGREGMRALEQDRPEANEWWRDHWSDQVRKHFFMTFPATLDSKINLNFWIFEPDAGNIQPVEGFLGSLMTHDELFERTFRAQQQAGRTALQSAQASEY